MILRLYSLGRAVDVVVAPGPTDEECTHTYSELSNG
jgi:hypothetical protein